MSLSVHVEPLAIQSFAPYGQAILGAEGKPNYTGDGWTSLFPAGKAHVPQGELGWVITMPSKSGFIVAGMEREPEVEMIWPTTGPIIQTVAPPGNLQNHKEQPNAEEVRAFLIKPGQVIIMHPGTWHYAAFPAGEKQESYYFLTRDHPREPGWEDVAWIPFQDGSRVKIDYTK